MTQLFLTEDQIKKIIINMPDSELEEVVPLARKIERAILDFGILEEARRYQWIKNNPEHESFPYYDNGKWYVPYLVSGAGGLGGGVGEIAFNTLDEAIDHVSGKLLALQEVK